MFESNFIVLFFLVKQINEINFRNITFWKE